MVCILYRRLYLQYPANTKNPLIIDGYTVIPVQIVPDPSVTLIRMFLMDGFDPFSNLLVFPGSFPIVFTQPFIIRRSGNVKQGTNGFYGITKFFMAVSDGFIQMVLPYLRKASLLSISSNFFNTSRSICNI